MAPIRGPQRPPDQPATVARDRGLPLDHSPNSASVSSRIRGPDASVVAVAAAAALVVVVVVAGGVGVCGGVVGARR